jgi:glutathione S-transferase
MIVVHHLNDSRSQRILWLLEELGVPYEIKRYQRDPQTRLAPPELKQVHPLGKSPVITDGGRTIIESGAIVDYIVRRHGNGRLQPAVDSPEYDEYVQWLHYSEGSAMLPLIMNLYVMTLGEGGKPLHDRINSQIASHLGFINQSLSGKRFLVGDTFSAADIQMSFVGEVAGAFGLRSAYPNMDGWVKGLHERPAYKKALEKWGPYAYSN